MTPFEAAMSVAVTAGAIPPPKRNIAPHDRVRPPVESFNVAIAAALISYEAQRQRASAAS